MSRLLRAALLGVPTGPVGISPPPARPHSPARAEASRAELVPPMAPRRAEPTRAAAVSVAGAKVGSALDVRRAPSRKAPAVALPARALGPLGETFALTPTEMTKVWARAPRAQAQAARLEAFRSALDGCDSKDALADFARTHQTHFGGEPLTPEQQTLVLERLKKKSMWSAAAAYYERSVASDPAFSALPIPAEHYLVALNKSEQFTKSVAHAKGLLAELAPAGRPLCAATLDVHSISRSPTVNGETLGALGSAFRSISDRAAGERLRDDLAEVRAALSSAQARGETSKASTLEARAAFLEELHRAITGKSVDEAAPLTDEHRALVHEELGLAARDVPRGFDYGRAALDISTKYYEAGYAADFEYYPGINAIHNHHALGNTGALVNLGPLVEHSLLQAGGPASKDYWCLATQLELALLRQDNPSVRTLLPKVLAAASADWEVGTTAKSIIKLIDTRLTHGGDARVAQHVYALLVDLRDGKVALPLTPAKLDEARAGLDALLAKPSKPSLTAPVDKAAGHVKQAELWDAIATRSTHFGEMSNHYSGLVLRGNVRYGGIIPDIKVSRPDVELTRALIAHLELPSLTDADAWNAKVDAYLGKQLHLETSSGRRPLEDLHSAEHEFMDKVRTNILEFTGVAGDKRATRDSKTSLMVSVALGCVDCRETAFAKQLIYDVCKKDQQNALKREALQAVERGDRAGAEQAMRGVEALDGQQLVTLSAMIRAPIAMEALYKPVVTAEGARVRDAQVSDSQRADFTDVENHTFNALIQRNPDGTLSLEWRDAFYQQQYQWGRLPVVPEQIFDAAGFMAGTMKPRDERGQPIPVQAVLTKYSKGTIDTLSGEHGGSMHLFGLEAAQPQFSHLTAPNSLRPLLDALARGPVRTSPPPRSGAPT